MQIASSRYLVLTAVLLVGAALYAVISETHGVGQPRWPQSDAAFQADGWATGPLKLNDDPSETALLTRVFQHGAGATATLTLVASQTPKLYGAGAEVPFLGNGYVVEAPPQDLVPTDGNVGTLLARRGSEQWLVLYAYGERRGLLGNGVVPWTLAVADGLLGQSNDYYKMYLAARADRLDDALGRDIAQLAHTVFPRIADWYAS
jgi:hypothetical protein